MRKVDLYCEQQKFREQITEGAFYSELDLKRSKAEGGLGLPAKPDLIDTIIHALLGLGFSASLPCIYGSDCNSRCIHFIKGRVSG